MAEMSITTTNESQEILLWTDFTSYFTSNELALHCLETLITFMYVTQFKLILAC